MLRESSTSSAMMFCCGFNSATVMAGCQSSTSRIAASSVCSPQMTQVRQPRTVSAACARCERISHASATPAATISSASTHFGHAPNRANWPCAYTERGYFRKNSNMGPGRSVGHGVRNVVQHDAKRQAGKFLGILGTVGPLPGITQVHVGANRHHDAAVVVADGTPLGHVAIFLISPAGID